MLTMLCESALFVTVTTFYRDHRVLTIVYYSALVVAVTVLTML